jgi:hypothetical protein
MAHPFSRHGHSFVYVRTLAREKFDAEKYNDGYSRLGLFRHSKSEHNNDCSRRLMPLPEVRQQLPSLMGRMELSSAEVRLAYSTLEKYDLVGGKIPL